MTRRWTVAGGLVAAVLLVACAPGRIGDDDWNAGEPLLPHPKAKTGPLYAESVVVDFDAECIDLEARITQRIAYLKGALGR